MKISKSILTKVLLFVSAFAVITVQSSCTTTRHTTSAPYQNVDPVCGTTIEKDTELSYEYKGRIYYFDSSECLAVFKKNPEKFAGNHQRPDNNRGMSGMHMGWLFPATGVIMAIGMIAAMLFGMNH